MRLMRFNAQAWVNDNAIDVDAEGPTTFTVPKSHLEKFTADELKYELEPYLQFAPEWIRNHRGPFFVEEDPTSKPAPFKVDAPGVLIYRDWELQNPNLMDPSDTDTQWYATHPDEIHAVGPFNTLDEAFTFFENETIDL